MNIDTLVMMANQIARNLAARGEEVAVAAVAEHIRDFWDPRMIKALHEAARDSLEPIARAALTRLGDSG